MEKEKNSNIEMLSDVIKNGVEAGIKIASKHYHMITDLQQLLFEKDKVFRMLGEQVFQMIDQGRIFAPAIMQTTFRAAKEIIERIAHLEEERKNIKKEPAQNTAQKSAATGKKAAKTAGLKQNVNQKKSSPQKAKGNNISKNKTALSKNIKKAAVMKKKKK